MRNDAIARDLQSKHTFTKCLNALQKYPLPLNSGKECIILEGFGEKICQAIDKKLDQFLLDGGKLHENDDETSSSDEINLLKTSEKEREQVKEILIHKENRKRHNICADDEIENVESDNSPVKSSNAKKIASNREYKPEFRSGAYALLITLLNNEIEKDAHAENPGISKEVLMKEAQKHCDSSFTTSAASNHYTAWSSMSTLIKKNLVIKSNKKPSNYSLTEQGRDLAFKLIDSNNSEQQNPSQNNNNDNHLRVHQTNVENNNLSKNKNKKKTTEAILIESSDSESNNDLVVIPTSSSIKQVEKISNINSIQSDNTKKPTNSDILVSLPADSYEIILLVDTCETTHAKRQEIFLKELEKTDIKYEISKLNIGDFAWIARSKFGTSFQNTDVILDYIVERKRVDDLCQSIIDGRYKEQKFRLKRSGISNIIYLIEHFGSMKNFSLPEASIKQAIVNTQIIDEFSVKETQNVKDSVNYLVEMTKYLIDFHKGLNLNACLKEKLDEYYGKFPLKLEKEKPHTYLMTFQEFNQNSNKNKPPTVKEMFGRCLIQINGLSQDKCIAILENYPTPAHLYKAYESCENENARYKLLANLKCGKQNRNLGPALSKLLAMIFYKKESN